ncbi:NUDIX hydrolase [Parasedimentitalea psychrophila]|uniref:NUDIX hydrolase n=1 Tax=Parasedimentitalea psychrophila TaxID=2997337 RepID=A0A9Y2L145_9RHOB|nr:NUDIX hydrolase [Parasedimentitalea psychrophila]WIY26840.1 NUDIX hydrolase [Parasedimentitalea psychrophila]
MIRRFGEPPQKGRHYHRRPGAYALLPRDGCFLLTCQSDPDPDLQLPGGGIDPGESPLTALHREVHEETGWSISTPQKIGVFRRFVYMPEYDLWAEKLCHIYIARPALRLGPPREKGHQPVWIDQQKAASLLGNPGDRHFAAQIALQMAGF